MKAEETHEPALAAGLRSEVERMSILLEEAGAILGSLHVEEILPAILALAERVLAADAHALWRLADGRWRMVSVEGVSDAYRAGVHEAITHGPAEVSLAGALVVEDVDRAEWMGPEHRAAQHAEGIRAMLVQPLRIRGEAAGTLVFYFRAPRVFSEAELRLSGALADLAGTAIGTAELYGQQAQAAEDRRFLAEASEVLSSSLDFETTLANVAALAVPQFADWCAVDLVDDGGGFTRLAVAHVDPAKVRWAEELAARYPPDPAAPSGVPAVIRTGLPEVAPEITDEMLVEATRDAPERLALLRELGLTSAMIVPLVSHERVLGAISFVAAESGRHYDDDDRRVAQDLARHAALAVENSLLFRRAEESLAVLDSVLSTAPVGLGFWDRDFRSVRVNAALAAINGVPEDMHVGRTLEELVPELARTLRPMWERILESGAPMLDIEVSGETPAAPGVLRHWLASYYAVVTPAGDTIGIGAVMREITETRHMRRQATFLAEASEVLARSLDYEDTLQRVARIAVPELAGQCIIDLLGPDGVLRPVALAHVDPEKEVLLSEVRRRYPPLAPGHPVQEAMRTGAGVLLPELSDESRAAMAQNEHHAELIRELANESGLVVPLVARGRTLGAITLGTVAPQPRFGEGDLALAVELARRAAVAVDNALLYRAAEERARASQALAFVGDGVFLVDREAVIRLWNPAAEAITGRSAGDVLGRTIDDALPGWPLRPRVVRANAEPAVARAETHPVEVDGRELWLSMSAVGFREGTVYAFRDMTDERALERMKTDFVSTVSHELRTPLAAIYGAALTLRREDAPLTDDQRHVLLDIVAAESDRLARIVNDILWASRVESGMLQISIERCDGGALANAVVRTARLHLPPEIELTCEIEDDLPAAAADPDKVRQVLTNLVGNAVKYSPDGGAVQVRVAPSGRFVRFAVRDSGLGIPLGEHERIFEKFYRLDPNLNRGVGGTGLGLYICRELVQRMDGRIWVDSLEGRGSTFYVDLPQA